MKKCVRCKRRVSIMVDEPEVMPLCSHCHDEIGLGIKVGREVVDPEAWPDGSLKVVRFDGPSIAVCTYGDGWEIYLPATMLITTKPLVPKERARWVKLHRPISYA